MKQSKNNFERLQDNKRETKTHVEGYLKDHSEPNTLETLKKETITSYISSYLVSGISNYSHIIMYLEKVRDLEHGITRTIVDHSDGSKDLIRDARNAKYPPDMDSNTSHLISALNVARAAEKIIDFASMNTSSLSKDLIKKQLNSLLEKYKNGEKIDNKIFNTEIIKILMQVGIKGDIAKKLAETGEYLSISDPQYHVSTITSAIDKDGKQRNVVESENMLLGLTPELRVQFNEVKKVGNNPEEIAKLDEGYSWYKEMSPMQQQLVRDSVDKILAGCVIPTQLRKSIPGIRNAHAKTTYGTEAGKTSLVTIQETLHTGTLSFHGKGDTQSITDMNVAQLQSFVPEGSVLNINVLNSPINPTGLDKSIDKQVSKAQMKNGGLKSTTPFNFFRLFSRNDNSGFEQTIRELAQRLQVEYFNNKKNEVLCIIIGTYLITGKNEIDVRATLERSTLDPAIKSALVHAINAKKLLISPHFLYDPKNSNVDLTSEMKRLEFEMKQGVLKQLFGENSCKEIISTMCASGKDRTGVAETETTRKAIIDFVGCDNIENFEKQIKGQHTQVMASLNGGTKGAHGIKKESAISLPKNPFGKIVGLYQKSSSLNTVKFNKFAIRLAKVKNIMNAIFGKKVSNKTPQSVKAAPVKEVSRSNNSSTLTLSAPAKLGTQFAKKTEDAKNIVNSQKNKLDTFAKEVANACEHFSDTLKRAEDMNSTPAELCSNFDKTSLEDESKRAKIMQRVFLTLGSAGLMVKNPKSNEWVSAKDNKLPLAVEFGVGPRVLIQIPKTDDPKKAHQFFNWLTSGNPSEGTYLNPNVSQVTKGANALKEGKVVFTRSMATHGVIIDSEGKADEVKVPAVREVKNFAVNVGGYYAGRSGDEYFTGHFGMNVGVGRYGEVDVKGNIVGANGATGHLYMYYKPPTDKEVGGLLIGMEGCEPLVSGQYGDHSIFGASDKLTVSGGRQSKELANMNKDDDQYKDSFIAERYGARRIDLTPEKMTELFEVNLDSFKDKGMMVYATAQHSSAEFIENVNKLNHQRKEFAKADIASYEAIFSPLHNNKFNKEEIDNFIKCLGQLLAVEKPKDMGALKDYYKGIVIEIFNRCKFQEKEAEDFRKSIEEHLAKAGRNERLNLVYDVHAEIYKSKSWEIGPLHALYTNRLNRVLNAASSTLSTMRMYVAAAATAFAAGAGTVKSYIVPTTLPKSLPNKPELGVDEVDKQIKK
jgi:hypothetical protein